MTLAGLMRHLQGSSRFDCSKRLFDDAPDIAEFLCPALEGLLQRAVPVENSNDEHPLGFNHIDEPIRPDDELAEARELRVTQAVSAVRRSNQRISCLDRQLRQAARVRF